MNTVSTSSLANDSATAPLGPVISHDHVPFVNINTDKPKLTVLLIKQIHKINT